MHCRVGSLCFAGNWQGTRFIFYYQVRNCAIAIPLTLKLVTQAEAQAKVVCYTAVLSVAPPRVLRDDTKNGCVAD